jgi:hypothetical protein
LAIDLAKCEADAIAIPERWRWMQLEFRQGHASRFQTRAELFCFESKLRGVSEVLELASTAWAEVRAKRNCAVLRWDVAEVV